MSGSRPRGQAFLALIFVIGIVVTIVGITIVFLTNSFIDTGYGYQASTQAEAVATSGVNDALIQIDRNNSGLPSPDAYTLAVGSSTASVTITQNSPSAGFITIFSTATVSSRVRKINVVLSLNASTSQASIVSWQDVQ